MAEIPFAYYKIRARLHDVTGHAGRESGGQTIARCPAHNDGDPSLSVRAIEGQALVWCHAGCDTRDVLAALDLTLADLYDDRKGATYRYASGRVVHRAPTKKFRQSGDVSSVELYRAERLDPSRNRAVFLVEGEKDVHAIEAAGGVATTAPMGAANFDKVNVEPLRDLSITVVVDKDASGRKWAGVVATRLAGVAKGVRFVEAKVGKDAADHVAAGCGLTDFVPIEISPVAAGRTLVATAAAGMTMRAPKWLADLRIPVGGITLLGGREGIGKSTISYDFAAKVTRGTLPGRYEGMPMGVAVVAGEDSWDCVILPRLVAAHADLDRVYRVEARDEDGAYDSLTLPADLDRLAKVCDEKNIVLVIVDPLVSAIHAGLDTHKDRELRMALDPLARFAVTTGVSVLGLIHVNKSGTSDPLDSLMGSRAFTAVARSVLYCLADPDAEQEDQYLFGHTKSNLGPKQPTLSYRLVEVKLELDDDEDPVVVTSRVVWGDVDDRSIRDAMETPRPGRAVGHLKSGILAWFDARGAATGAVAATEIAEAFPDVNRNTLNVTLGRLVKADELHRPVLGHYARARRSDKSSVPRHLSLVSPASSDPEEPTEVTEVTAYRTSQHLSQADPEQVPERALSDWAADLYDRER